MADDLRRLTECSVCMNTYRDPRVLACGHTFCLLCLQNMAQKETQLHCPQCRAMQPNFTTADAVVRNIDMQKLVEGFEQLMTTTLSCSEGPLQGQCQYCNRRYGNEDLRHCVQHDKYVCYKCVAFEHRECTIVSVAQYCTEKVQKFQKNLGPSKHAIDKLRKSCAEVADKLRLPQDAVETLYGRHLGIRNMLADAVETPERAMQLISNSNLLDVEKTLEEIVSEVKTAEKALVATLATMCTKLSVSSSDLFGPRPFEFTGTINVKSGSSEPYKSNKSSIIHLIRNAITMSADVTQVPHTIVTMLKQSYAVFDWHCTYCDIQTMLPDVMLKLNNDFVCVASYKAIGPAWIHAGHATDFLKSVNKTQIEDRNKNSKYIAQEASKALWYNWLCTIGKRGSMVVACSDPSRQIFIQDDGDFTFALWRT